VFRAETAATSEFGYLRMHKSGLPDAVQYTPYLNDESNWQLFPQHQIAAAFGDDDWVSFEIAFSGDQARMTVRGAEEHVMRVDDLVRERSVGRIGLRSLFGGCFSSFEFRPGPVELEPPAPAATPEGLITAWRLSPSRPFDGFANRAPQAGGDWSISETQSDGLLLISRYREKSGGGGFEQNPVDVVDAAATLNTDRARLVPMAFDASDRARVYLNGQPLYEMDNTFRAKGPLFRGDFGREEQIVMLPLEAGENTLTFSVADRANGWGLAARLLETDGLEVRP